MEERQVQRHQGRNELDVPKDSARRPVGRCQQEQGGWRWMCFHIPWGPSLINCIDFISGGMETDQNILSRETCSI